MRTLVINLAMLLARRKSLIPTMLSMSLLIVNSCEVVLAGRTLDIDGLFRSGNEHFARGECKAAIQEYSEIVRAGFIHEAVYYNLGDAYFKDGQMGKAILFYERAMKIDPHDREIRENLALARARIVDKVEVPQATAVFRVINHIRGWLPLDLETALATILFVGANGVFSYHLLRKGDKGASTALIALGLLILSLLLGISNAVRIYENHAVREAIILSEKVDVLSGPGSDHSTLFSVHDGLKVTVQNEVGDWSLVRLENGWNGWVKKDVLELI
jgi:tetratricopeptide (TPR) repeat protein